MKKQNIAIIGVVAFILAVAVGYAIFTDTLTIKGTATAKGDFDVEFTSVGEITKVGYTETNDDNGDGTAANIAVIDEKKNKLTIIVNKLDYPGAYVEIPVTITNKGSIPAILKSIEETGLTTDLSIKVTYTNLQELKEQELSQNGTQTFLIKVMWDENSTTSSENVSFTIKLNYEQITLQ